MSRKKKGIQEIAAVSEPITVEPEVSAKDLRAHLEEIKTFQGVIGYIMRNSTSATIDLKDPTKIIDFAIISSSALDASKEFSELFNLGDVGNIVVQGKKGMVISLTVGENKISIFTEKDVDREKILRKLR